MLMANIMKVDLEIPRVVKGDFILEDDEEIKAK